MTIPTLPFNALLGLEPADPACGFLVSLPADVKYTNHFGTVHAAALFAVAEVPGGCDVRPVAV